MLSSGALDTSAAAVAGAASSLIINGDGAFEEFWSQIPSMPSTYEVAVGTALSFRYTTGHNVWLMPTEEAYDACDFSSATELASSTHGGGQPPLWPNLFEAVANETGELLFACEAVFYSHCGRGQKIRVTVLPGLPPSLPPPRTPPPTPLSPATDASTAAPPSAPASAESGAPGPGRGLGLWLAVAGAALVSLRSGLV